jgi:hypothetical protein
MSNFILKSQFGPGLQDPSNYFAGNDSGAAGTTNVLTNVETFISNVIGVLTVLGGLFFVFFFVQGAFSWITAGGDSGQIEKARNKMIQGVLGLIVLVASYAIIGLIGAIVGLNLLNPAKSLEKLVPASATSTTTAPVAPIIK